MIKQLEIGKFYRDGNTFIRVDYYDHTLEPMGVMIIILDGNVSITKDTDLYYMTIDGIPLEITKEEFEASLNQAKSNLEKLITEIKSTE